MVDTNGPPLEMAQAYGDLGPAIFAAMSIISAIRHRDRSQWGQMIDVAQLDCMVALNTALTGYNRVSHIRHTLQAPIPEDLEAMLNEVKGSIEPSNSQNVTQLKKVELLD